MFVCHMPVIEQEDEKEKEEESLRVEDSTTVVHLPGKVVGVSMTKPSISIGSLCLISL